MLLVNEIYDLDYIIVNNPNEALILENNFSYFSVLAGIFIDLRVR